MRVFAAFVLSLAAAVSALAATFSVNPVRIFMKAQDRAVAVTLATKAKQVVRLARLKPADASRQLTYRLIMREIPEVTAPKDNIQVTVALALSLPVFITPAPAKRNVVCDASRGEADTLNVGCANNGSAYAQVREVLVKQGERVLGRFEGGAYVLPGSRKVVPVKAENVAPGTRLQLVVSYDDGRSDIFEVTVG